MNQTVLITGTGRPYALGFNLVKRYLEHGDCVFATIRRPSEALEVLKKEYPDRLHILTMDTRGTAFGSIMRVTRSDMRVCCRS